MHMPLSYIGIDIGHLSNTRAYEVHVPAPRAGAMRVQSTQIPVASGLSGSSSPECQTSPT